MAAAHTAREFTSAWTGLICILSGALKRRLRGPFEQLSVGWVLCLGRRTVTNILKATPKWSYHWTSGHRFFAKSRWWPDDLFQVLVQKIIDPLIPAEQPWRVAIDDTTAHKYGRRVAFAAKFRDAARSTLDQPAFHWSHNWVIACVLIPLPWHPGRYVHLPVLVRLFKKKEHGASDAFRTHGQLAAEMVRCLQQWLPHRRFQVVADPLYVGQEFLETLPPPTVFVGRLKKNAGLYELPVPAPKGRRGRKPTRGVRLPKLAELAQRVAFVPAIVRTYGVERSVLLHSFICVWHGASRSPVRVVIVRQRDGDYYLFSTDTQMDPLAIVNAYASRWGIEEVIREVKQSLGFDTVQGWSRKAVLRQAPFAVLLNALVRVSYFQSHAICFDANAKEQTDLPSFHRMLTELRMSFWQKRINAALGPTSKAAKLIAPLEAVFLTAC